MRTLGPRSVSSFLKIALDIAYVALAIALVVLGVMAMLMAVNMVNPDIMHWKPRRGYSITPVGAAARLLIGCLFTLGLMGIVGRLRKIFATLVAGQPFQLENAKRLRIIGLILAALEASRFGVYALLMWGLQSKPMFLKPDINFTALFAIGVMFVLAEVFEEGVRMRKDLDLTI
jgi:hypothetical protein